MSKTRVSRATFPRLSQFAREYLLLLPLGAVIALVWVNSFPESYYRLTYAVSFAVNDVAMTLFFALMTKEVVEATAPGGVLHPWRRAIVPVIAAVGAVVVPALIHVRVVEALEEPVLAIGWPVTLATDLAISYFVARLIFRQHAVIAFLLLLGIASDTFGFLVLDVAILQPLGTYTNRWLEIGGGSNWWYHPVWWMVGTFLPWMGAFAMANQAGRRGASPIGVLFLALVLTALLGALGVVLGVPYAGWNLGTFAVAFLPAIALTVLITGLGARRG